jgi:hypothetical protein
VNAAQENQPDLGRPASPGAAPAGAGKPSDRPSSMPKSVRYATILMVVGIAVTALDIIGQYSELSGNRGQLLPSAGGPLFTSRFDALASLFIVGGLIKAGLWLWMALVCRRGRNWGRVVATIFFGAGCLEFGVGCVAVLFTTVLTTSSGTEVLDALPIMIGLAAVIMLWSEQSGPHFHAAATPVRPESGS